MATLLNVERVQYLCSCGVWEPLCRLYFCRHCTVLRCAQCVSHEIDSNYCPNCLENMPSAEARHKKNRCANCLECPCCFCALAVRATSLLPPGVSPEHSSASERPSASLAPKKAYYLVCNACHWTSRSAGINDQTVATGHWPLHKNNMEKSLSATLDYYRQLASLEKTERERKKLVKRRSHMSMFYTDKYGMPAIYARKRYGGMIPEKSATDDFASESTVIPTDEIPELPEDIFTEELNLLEISSVEQRHKQPLSQSPLLKELFPANKRLMVRRSLRCKQCDHNLCKGEYNPSSVKFKIQMFGILHVPEIRLLEQPKLKHGEECELRLTLSNLTSALMHLVLLPNATVIDDPQFANVVLPASEIILPHRDETAELDEENVQFKDDEDLILYRKRHKLGFKLSVVPNKVQGDVWASFIIKYDYVNTTYVTSGGETKEPEIIWLQQTVKINLGHLPRED